ncbi:MAG: hypothetical protein CFE33_02190 [Pseudorhodobacter sp. PARRP1]|nr:MAG: hypothetical protein CFE33_02190 [Pseudorhodobacter sp. PARRP1]
MHCAQDARRKTLKNSRSYDRFGFFSKVAPDKTAAFLSGAESTALSSGRAWLGWRANAPASGQAGAARFVCGQIWQISNAYANPIFPAAPDLIRGLCCGHEAPDQFRGGAFPVDALHLAANCRIPMQRLQTLTKP